MAERRAAGLWATGRQQVRAAATLGVSSVDWSFPLPDGGELHLLVGLDRDRNGTTSGGSVAPDEPRAGPAEAVAAVHVNLR